MTADMRINKYLALHGQVSRRKADTMIRGGGVLVNGKPATLGMDIGETDHVSVRGASVSKSGTPRRMLIALHKPVGYISTTDRSRPDNVLDLVRISERLFLIGRLDVESSGLVLLTNDGDLAQRLMHPSYDHEKEYIVTVDRPLSRHDAETMEAGMILDGKKTRPAEIPLVKGKTFHLILKEGRNRQIRNMCERLGYRVERLHRIRIGNIRLGNLAEGKYRILDGDEG